MTERGSTHHSPRVDEELAHETAPLTHGAPMESRADEWRLKEGPGDDEPYPDAQITHGDDALAGSLSTDEVEQRSMLAVSLRPSAFPASARRLREVAELEHADPAVLDWLDRLPDGLEFVNVQEVWEALGGGAEHRDAVTEAPSPREHTTQGRAVEEPAPSPSTHPTSGSPLERVLHVPALAVRTAGQAVGVVVSFAESACARLSRLRPGSGPSDR
jgi:hypothetical protein